eukprot:14979280-Alexandrium_andersonii.AAC.1
MCIRDRTRQLGAPLRGAPKLLCERIFAQSMVPVGRRARVDSEGPLWKGAGLPQGISTMGRWPVLRPFPNYCDFADF